MLLLYTWVITGGRWNLLQTTNNRDSAFDGVFDAQARAIFDGRLDVPPEAIGYEAFYNGDRTYMYFGMFPSLLRMPVLAVTSSLDAKLTTISMLLAGVVLAVSAFRLCWMLRLALRDDTPLEPGEQWLVTGLAIAVLLGPPLILYNAAIVYHEAIIWGLAWSVAGYDAVIRWQRQPNSARLLVAGVLVALALLSRQSVALGPLVALGIAGGVYLVRRWQAEPRHAEQLVRPAGALLAVCTLPLALVSALNYARLGVLFGLPFERYSLFRDWSWMYLPELDLSDIRSIDPSYLGYTVRSYFRPLGIAMRSDFPWLDLPTAPQKPNPGDIFPLIDPVPSLYVISPALCTLAVIGVVWALRSRDRQVGALTPLIVGSIAGAAVVMTYCWVATRYLADLFPMAVLGGFVGAHIATPRYRLWSKQVRRFALTGLVIMIAVGSYATLSVTLEIQREHWAAAPHAWRADWARLRARLPGNPTVRSVRLADPMPFTKDSLLLVVGDCDGLYMGGLEGWTELERGPGSRIFDVRVDLDEIDEETTPLVDIRTRSGSTTVGALRLGEKVRFDVRPENAREWTVGQPTSFDDNDTTIQLDTDPRSEQPALRHGIAVHNARPGPNEPVDSVGTALGRRRETHVLNPTALPTDVERDDITVLSDAAELLSSTTPTCRAALK